MKKVFLFSLMCFALSCPAQFYAVDDTAFVEMGIPDTVDVHENDFGGFTYIVLTFPPHYGTATICNRKIILNYNTPFTIDSVGYWTCEDEMSTCDSATVYVFPADTTPLTSVKEGEKEEETIVRTTNIIGQDIPGDSKGFKIVWYSNGRHEKIYEF